MAGNEPASSRGWIRTSDLVGMSHASYHRSPLDSTPAFPE